MIPNYNMTFIGIVAMPTILKSVVRKYKVMDDCRRHYLGELLTAKNTKSARQQSNEQHNG